MKTEADVVARKRLPEDRKGTTRHFTILTATEHGPEEVDGYIQTGEYVDGTLGEVFIKVGKAGDAIKILDQWAIAVSIALQYGAPVDDLFRKFVGSRFEPSGPTNLPGIRLCTSPVDLVSRYILEKYAPSEEIDVPVGESAISKNLLAP